jgi:hypothetical protein
VAKFKEDGWYSWRGMVAKCRKMGGLVMGAKFRGMGG